jgi:cytochrome c oxidase subunit 1
MTFGPFHILGLQGMPRRIYTYPSHRGWDFWNMISTIGSFVIAAAVLLFIYNVWSSRKNPKVGNDPWDARTLEWSIPSPPPEYNFAEVPLVTARDDLWHRKYTEDENGRSIPRHPADAAAEADTEAVVRAAVTDEGSGDGDGSADDAHEGGDANDGDGHEADGGGHEEHEPHIHMPSPSYWPAFTSIGLAVICYGMIYRVWVVAILGGLWVLGGLYAWSLEPATAPDEPELDTEPSTDLEPVGAGPAGSPDGDGESD